MAAKRRKAGAWPAECRAWRWEVVDSKGRAFGRCPTRQGARFHASDYVGARVRDRMAKRGAS